MARLFECPACGSEIIVKFLGPGEVARCRHCGESTTVPETSQEVEAPNDHLARPSGEAKAIEPVRVPGVVPLDGNGMQVDPDLLAHCGRDLSGVKLFNPNSFVWIGALFSFLLPMILVAVNWGRLGYQKRKWLYLLGALAAAAALYLLGALQETTSTVGPLRGAFLGLNIGVSYFLKRGQQPTFNLLRGFGARSASILLPVGISVVVVAGVLILMFLPEGDPWCDELARVGELMNEGRLREASARLEELVTVYPDAVDLHWYKALCHVDLNQNLEAAKHLLRCIELAPEFSDAYFLLAVVRERQGHLEAARRLFENAESLDPEIRSRYATDR